MIKGEAKMGGKKWILDNLFRIRKEIGEQNENCV